MAPRRRTGVVAAQAIAAVAAALMFVAWSQIHSSPSWAAPRDFPAASIGVDSDGDGVPDDVDACPFGENGWISNATTDHDGDGCRDATEDADDDNDGVPDGFDACPLGDTGWTSNTTTDNDLDGCLDATEDFDDDNDGIPDDVDNCPLIDNPDQTDTNGNGIGDACETSGVGDRLNLPLALALTGANPFSSSTAFELRFPAALEGAPFRLAVYDMRGRQVADLAHGLAAQTPVRVSWSGTDASGRRIPAGLYAVRLTVAGQSVEVKVVGL